MLSMEIALGVFLAILLGLLFACSPLAHMRVRSRLRESRALYVKKEYDRAIAVAQAAAQQACSELGDASAMHLRAISQIALMHSDQGEHDRALAVLDDADRCIKRTHGWSALQLATSLSMRAQICTAAKRTQLAVDALNYARVLVEKRVGDCHVDYGRACFEQAKACVRHAVEAPQLADAQRSAVVDQAVELALEASYVADKTFDSHEGDELVEALLEQLLASYLAGLPACEAAIARLRDHLRDHFEHFGGAPRDEGGGSVTSEAASTSKSE